MTKIKMGVIGYGGMGSYHVSQLIDQELFEMVGIYDIAEARQEAARENYLKVYASLEAILGDPAIEVVLIATPNDVHHDLAVAALKAGKNVICEKPAMLSTAELDDVVEVAKQNNKHFIVHQNRRWDPDFLIVKSIYEQKPIGDLFQIESRVHGANGIPGDWRHLKVHGGGMLLDWGVHLLDQLLWMVDSPVTEVAADFSYILGDDADDGFIAYLTFENGIKAICEVGTTNYIKLPRWYVKGYEGTGIINDWDNSGKMVMQKGPKSTEPLKPIQAGVGLTKTMAPPSEDSVSTLPLPAVPAVKETFYQNVYHVIRDNEAPIVKCSEVRTVLALIDTLFEAGEKHQTMAFKERETVK